MRGGTKLWGLIAGAGAFGLVAQSLPAQDQRHRLAEAKAQSEAAAQRSARLEAQAAHEQDQARQARAQEAAVAARIQQAEADIAAGQARIEIIRRQLADRLVHVFAEVALDGRVKIESVHLSTPFARSSV